MNFTGFGRSGDQQYFNTLTTNKCISRLEVPDGKHANRNAWMTITVNFRLNFVDSKNPGSVVFDEDGKHMVWDSNKTDPVYKDEAVRYVVKDWDARSKANFEEGFKAAAKFWNQKFLLITPHSYGGLDYTVSSIPGVVHRPNVICLYNLDGYGVPVQFYVNVVRVGDEHFRSNSGLLGDLDVRTGTIYHELWHSMEHLHIQGVMGNYTCITSPNLDECYEEPDVANRFLNVAGRGRALSVINAKPWIELIARHTSTVACDWRATMNTHVGPRILTTAEAARDNLKEMLLPINF